MFSSICFADSTTNHKLGPADAVSIVETDMNVEFLASPQELAQFEKQAKEAQQRKAQQLQSDQTKADETAPAATEPKRFPGSGIRIDEKPLKKQQKLLYETSRSDPQSSALDRPGPSASEPSDGGASSKPVVKKSAFAPGLRFGGGM